MPTIPRSAFTKGLLLGPLLPLCGQIAEGLCHE